MKFYPYNTKLAPNEFPFGLFSWTAFFFDKNITMEVDIFPK